MSPIPPFDLKRQYKEIGDELQDRVGAVLASGRYILSGEVKQFEEGFSQLEGVKHTIGVANGSDALLLALMALDIKPGDEVITTPFTFFATASCISRLGATPVFVDVREDTYNIDEEKIEAAITEKTKAIIVVHLFGQMANMPVIMELADEHSLFVVEDAAQSVQAMYDGKTPGHYGAITTYSMYPTKNLGALGDAGAITTQDDELGDTLRMLRAHGASNRYYHKIIGVNSRLDEIQAAILNVKLPHLASWIARRREIASLYSELLADVDQVIVPYEDPKAKHVFHQYTIVCGKRDELRAYLQEKEIGNMIYYPVPLHKQDCFSDLNQADACPIADKLAGQVLSLPMFPELTDAEAKQVVEAVKAFYAQ